MTLPHALNSPGMLDNRLWPGCSLAVPSAWNRFSSTLGNLADVYRTSLRLILIGKPLPSVCLTRLVSPSPSPPPPPPPPCTKPDQVKRTGCHCLGHISCVPRHHSSSQRLKHQPHLQGASGRECLVGTAGHTLS